MDAQIPILVLDLVLFPGMPLPLHIFEPRYRLMIQRCMEDDQRFGVALPLPTAPEANLPYPLPTGIGTVTQVLQIFPLPDGRFNLQTRGEQRFRVHSVEIVDDYPVANVEWIDDTVLSEDAVTLSYRVHEMAQKYFQDLAVEAGLDVSHQPALELPEDPYQLSMWIAAALPMPTREKQVLLELTSTDARLENLLQYLQCHDLIRRAAQKQGISESRPFSWDMQVSLN